MYLTKVLDKEDVLVYKTSRLLVTLDHIKINFVICVTKFWVTHCIQDFQIFFLIYKMCLRIEKNNIDTNFYGIDEGVRNL